MKLWRRRTHVCLIYISLGQHKEKPDDNHWYARLHTATASKANGQNGLWLTIPFHYPAFTGKLNKPQWTDIRTERWTDHQWSGWRAHTGPVRGSATARIILQFLQNGRCSRNLIQYCNSNQFVVLNLRNKTADVKIYLWKSIFTESHRLLSTGILMCCHCLYSICNSFRKLRECLVQIDFTLREKLKIDYGYSKSAMFITSLLWVLQGITFLT